MKLKVQHLMDATLILAQIVQENRLMPQKGKYRIARMHAKFMPEALLIHNRRDDMIRAYDTKQVIPNPEYEMLGEEGRKAIIDSGFIDKLPPATIETGEYTVPEDKLPEFNAAWSEMAAQEIEIDVQPIPLDQLCFDNRDIDGGIMAQEILILGDLIAE